MVLTNPSESSGDLALDDAPSSDRDPYSDSALPLGTYHIDYSKLPRPVPIFGSLFGFTPKMANNFIELQAGLTQKTLGRPPTQEEMEAFVQIAYKQVSTVSYYPPLGIAAGAWRTYQTSSTFRFPFYQPNLDTFTPEAFPTSTKPFLRGARAVMAWHMLRTIPYVSGGLFLSSMFITSYASSVSSITTMTDPRLKDIVNAIREKGQQKMEQKFGSLQKNRDQKRTTGQQQQSGPATSQEDDASPTGGSWDGDSSEEYSAEPPTKPTAPPRPWPKVRPVPVESQAENSKDQPFDPFDDASPTGGQGMLEDTEPSPRQYTGSAWDRIRRGERPATSSQRPTQSAWSKQQDVAQPRESSPSEDSFTFSKSAEERAYAQEQAQKEFDARVERERRGGDFSQNGGDQKRW